MKTEDFLKLAGEKVGKIRKTKQKCLEKDQFIKIFRLATEFAKVRTHNI